MTVAAEEGRLPGQRIGAWLLFGLLAIYLLLPLLSLLLYSLATVWRANILPDGYTASHWLEAFSSPRVVGAFLRSTIVATVVVLLDIALVVPAAYWARVRNPRVRTIVELSAAIPFALPYVVIAFGILRLVGSTTATAWLLGSPWLLILGHAAICFPFLYWAVDGAMSAAGIERLSEAAEACGARPGQIVRRVVLPNITPGLVAGGILVFATSFGEFALAQVLSGAAFETVPLWQVDALDQTEGKFNQLAVVTFVTFGLLFALSAAVVFWNRGQTIRLLPG
nr:ABC transporter permease subunit [Chloroflexota bacterium]